MIRARSVVLYSLVTHLELPGSAKVRYKRLCLGQSGTLWGLPANDLSNLPFQTPVLPLCPGQSLQGRGFNLEDSGLSQPGRVSILMGAVGLAFVWCCFTGEYRAKRMPIPLLKHGYGEQSIFRYGFEHLQDIFFRLISRDASEQLRLLFLFDPWRSLR